MIRQLSSSESQCCPNSICSEDGFTSWLMINNLPQVPARGMTGFGHAFLFCTHEALNQVTTGEEPVPRGKLPAHWLASCMVERSPTAEREGGPLCLGPFQAGLQGRGLPNEVKGSTTEESTHSSFSKQRRRGKVKLCCSFESHPLEINSPFEGIAHPIHHGTSGSISIQIY